MGCEVSCNAHPPAPDGDLRRWQKPDRKSKAALSVKGVGPEAREIAKTAVSKAARRLVLGCSVVRRVGAAEASGREVVPAVAPSGVPATSDGSEATSQYSSAVAPAPSVSRAELVDEAELINLVTERVQATEDRLVTILTALEEIVVTLGDRVERLESRASISDAGGSDELERNER